MHLVCHPRKDRVWVLTMAFGLQIRHKGGFAWNTDHTSSHARTSPQQTQSNRLRYQGRIQSRARHLIPRQKGENWIQDSRNRTQANPKRRYWPVSILRRGHPRRTQELRMLELARRLQIRYLEDDRPKGYLERNRANPSKERRNRIAGSISLESWQTLFRSARCNKWRGEIQIRRLKRSKTRRSVSKCKNNLEIGLHRVPISS